MVSRHKGRRSTDRKRSIPKLLVVACLAFTGCDAVVLSEAPTQVCREVATQCQLAKGPLGVCERAACAANQEEPCFVCTPQH